MVADSLDRAQGRLKAAPSGQRFWSEKVSVEVLWRSAILWHSNCEAESGRHTFRSEAWFCATGALRICKIGQGLTRCDFI